MEEEKIYSFYDKYTKKQLYNLYVDAMCDEISDSRFDRIGAALHETVHLGQFSNSSFCDLLDFSYDYSLPTRLLNAMVEKIVEAGYQQAKKTLCKKL